MNTNTTEIKQIISRYIRDVKHVLGSDFVNALVYGSYARGEYGEDSDIDIAIFTNVQPEKFYILIDKISEITFEYNVEYDIMLSPVFQNISQYNRMMNALPYYQSIRREGILVG